MINGALAMKITTIQYFRISWLLPVILPLIAIVLESLFNEVGVRMPDMVGMGIGLAFSAVFMFFIPYAILVGAYLLLLYNRSSKAYAVAIMFSPAFMALLVSLFILIAGSSTHNESEMSLFYARYCLAIGYFYVALIFLLFWILRRIHLVREE
jgi:hypothetical protein